VQGRKPQQAMWSDARPEVTSEPLVRYDLGVKLFSRVTQDPDVMGGKPCIRGMRVTAAMIVQAFAAGRTIDQMLADFPYLEEPDIHQALAFARPQRIS
jgi:uncharacterized protein (DUF433 family)